MESKKTWVVIPAYNEAPRISEVLKKTSKYTQNIIVIDDGSTDKTIEEVHKHNVVLLQSKMNKGKGASLKIGCYEAMKRKAEYIILMDGDGQHDPSLIPEFMFQLDFNDIIFGCRSLKDPMPRYRRLGNWVICHAIKWLFGIKISDSLSGYKAFKVSVFDKIKWESDRYNVEVDILINTGKNKLSYKEIKIPTNYNNKWSGITKTEGFKILLHVIKRRIYG